MKRGCVFAAIALAGCSPMQYSSYDCEHLAPELRSVYMRAGELAHLGGTAAQYARLSAEHRALREAATIKKCAATLASPLPGAAPSSPDDQSGTGPTIAPPQLPSAFAPELST
jgi:hypothetical protein